MTMNQYDCLCGPDDCKILCTPIYAIEQHMHDRKLKRVNTNQ